MGFKFENIFEGAVTQVKTRWKQLLLSSIIVGLIVFVIAFVISFVSAFSFLISLAGFEASSVALAIIFGLIALVVTIFGGIPLMYISAVSNFIIAESAFEDGLSVKEAFKKTITKSNVMFYFTRVGLPLFGMGVLTFVIFIVLLVVNEILAIIVFLLALIGLIVYSIYLTSGILIPLYYQFDIKQARSQIFSEYSRKTIMSVYLIQFALELLLGIVSGIISIIPILGFIIQLILVSVCGGAIVQAMIINVRQQMGALPQAPKANSRATIKSDDLTVVIDAYGAQIVSAKTDQTEYMWQADPEFWGRSAPVLFPFVGKLKDDRYQAGGEIIEMNQHGFLRDRMFTIVKQDANSVTFEYTSTLADFNVYPVDFTVQISYQVVGFKVTTNYKVINNSSYEMPYQIGAHPAFNIDDLNQLQVVFPKQTVTQHYFANGLQTNTEQTELSTVDLSADLINKNIPCYSDFTDNQMILKQAGNDYLKFEFDSMRYLAIWSPEYKNAKFICIEPWNGICSRQDQEGYLLENKDGMNYLAANSSEVCSYSFEIC